MSTFKKSLLTTAAATAALALAAAPAMADRDARDASGTTRLTLNNKTLNKFAESGCGLPIVTTLGDAQIKSSPKSFQVLLPVTKVVLKDNQDNALQVQHDNSGVVVTNSCYEVKLTSFRLNNFPDPNDTGTLDVDARTLSSDEDGSREVLFTLNLTSANQNTSEHRGRYTKQTISNAGLYLAPDGAAEFNQLVTGSESTGPFSQNDQIGAGKTQIKYVD